MTDLAHWYSHAEAAAKLNISERTLVRLVTEGHKDFPFKPEVRKRQRDGGRKPENVYKPEDVDALAAQRETKVLAHPAPGPRLPALEQLVPPSFAGVLENCIKRLQLSQPLYLTIEEAHQVSGLSKAFLRRAAPEIGFRDGRTWKIPRGNLANSTRMAELAGLRGNGDYSD